MAGATTLRIPPAIARSRSAMAESRLARGILILIATGFLVLFLIIPLLAVFIQAFQKGVSAYLAAVTESDALSANSSL